MVEDAAVPASSVPSDDGILLDGPDIAELDVAGAVPGARLLFRGPIGDEESGLMGVLDVVGCARGYPPEESISCLSTRLDICDKRREVRCSGLI